MENTIPYVCAFAGTFGTYNAYENETKLFLLFKLSSTFLQCLQWNAHEKCTQKWGVRERERNRSFGQQILHRCETYVFAAFLLAVAFFANLFFYLFCSTFCRTFSLAHSLCVSLFKGHGFSQMCAFILTMLQLKHAWFMNDIVLLLSRAFVLLFDARASNKLIASI